jgi:hypothetical protein
MDALTEAEPALRAHRNELAKGEAQLAMPLDATPEQLMSVAGELRRRRVGAPTTEGTTDRETDGLKRCRRSAYVACGSAAPL